MFLGTGHSKDLSREQRAKHSGDLKLVCNYFIAEVGIEEIEKIGIGRANYLALRKAVEGLIRMTGTDLPIIVTVDGALQIPDLAFTQKTIKRGDQNSASIAAASIIAKAHRDEMMAELGLSFRAYCWHANSGYPTPEHLQLVKMHGWSPQHRRAFKCLKGMPELGVDT